MAGFLMYCLYFYTFLSVLVSRMFPVGSECSVPSSYWCDNEYIAKDCGVLEQCIKYASSNYEKPIDLVLYYESLCPDCSVFFRDQLHDVFYNFRKIVNITLVPFGNAQAFLDVDTHRYKFVCQHGSKECFGNLIETCAIHLLKDKSVYFPFIYCMETSEGLPIKTSRTCAQKHGVDLKPILECSKSPLGNKLEHEMAMKTDALRPQHTSVPWVTINGVYTNRIQQMAVSGLKNFVCDTYLGSSKPDACY